MRRFSARRLTLSVLLVLVSLGLLSGHSLGVNLPLPNRFDEMSSSLASATATHNFGFNITQTATALGSIKFQFCSNDPLPNLPCTAPSGMDASSVVLANQTNNTGFSVSGSSNANTVILTRIPSLPSGGANTYQLDNIVNPNTAATYYIRVYIYASTDASGPDTQDGGLAIAINSTLTVSAQVPPYILFCVGVIINNFDCTSATSYFVNLGNFSSSKTSSASSQFIVATNAQSGYSVSITGPTLTSGNNIIPALSNPTPSQIGVSQFGLNLRANTNPPVGGDPQGPGPGTTNSNYAITNQFTYNNGDTLASTNGTSDNMKFTVSYITNVNSNQSPGVYSTTLTYICLANF